MPFDRSKASFLGGQVPADAATRLGRQRQYDVLWQFQQQDKRARKDIKSCKFDMLRDFPCRAAVWAISRELPGPALLAFTLF